MALKVYKMEINGIEHAIQLEADEAKRRGLTAATVAKEVVVDQPKGGGETTTVADTTDKK